MSMAFVDEIHEMMYKFVETHDRIAIDYIEEMMLLEQENAWECGWYSIFHYIQRKTKIDATTDNYTAFISNITERDSDLKLKYERHAYLSTSDIENIAKFDDIIEDDLIFIEEQQMYKSIPVDIDIISKIRDVQKKGCIFWVILCLKSPAHWLCIEFNKKRCIVIDSLRFSQPITNKPIVKRGRYNAALWFP